MAVHARTECCSVCSVESVIVASWTFTACTAHRMHSSPAPAIKYGTNLHITIAQLTRTSARPHKDTSREKDSSRKRVITVIIG